MSPTLKYTTFEDAIEQLEQRNQVECNQEHERWREAKLASPVRKAELAEGRRMAALNKKLDKKIDGLSKVLHEFPSAAQVAAVDRIIDVMYRQLKPVPEIF